MRPLMTRSNSLPALSAPVSASRSGRLARRLPFALGAVTLAVLGAGAWMPAARAQGLAEAVPAVAVDAVNGPVVTILSPHYNDQLKGAAQVLVAVQARKNTPSTIELYVDGRLASDPGMALPGYPSANFAWETSKFSDGLHRLSVVITDTQGFRGGADVNVYINNNKVVDLTPPDLQWLNVRPNQTWSGKVDFQVKAVDNFGVKYLIISLNPASTPDRKPPAFSWGLNRPPYSISWDSRKLPDGLYSLRATAFDALENEGNSPAVTIAINNHSINPTWKLPDLPANALPSNRVLPQTDAQLGSSANASQPGATDSSAPMQLDNTLGAPSAALPSAALPSAALPSAALPAPQPGVAQSPALSSAPAPDDLAAAPARSAPASTWASTPAPRDGERVAAVDVPSRVIRRAAGSAAMSRPALSPRDGLALSPSPASPAQERGAGAAPRDSVLAASARAVQPGVAGRDGSSRLAAGTRRGRSAPSLSMAPGAAESSAPLGAGGGLSSSGLELSPLPPSRLPRVPERLAARPGGAPARPLLSGSQASTVGQSAPQGSVAAPAFPSVELTRAPGAQSGPRASAPPSPQIAMAPPMGVLKRMSQASITVAPALPSMLPILHRVLKGDTLASVAARYKLPVAVLAMHNHLSEDALLVPGQAVKLPQTLAVSMAGDLVQGDVSSMMVDTVGVTPFRFLFEKQGGKLEWDGANHRVTARNATHQVTLTIGSKSALVNQKEVMMDLAAFLVSGRTMVPLRFFEKALNASVEWEPATGRLLVAMAQ